MYFKWLNHQCKCVIVLSLVTPSITLSVICNTTLWPLHDEPYYWQTSHHEPQRGSTPKAHHPCLFMSAYQHPPRILSCLLITVWKSRLIQMSRPITCELSRGDLSPYLPVINSSWRDKAYLDNRRVGSDTLAKCAITKHDWRGGGGTVACSDHCCIKIMSFMTVLGQSAAVWLLCLW